MSIFGNTNRLVQETSLSFLSRRVLLAPMVGVTDLAFRQVVARLGCGLLFTEMVNARGLLAAPDPRRLLDLDPSEGLIGVQLAGSEPEVMAAAAVLAVKMGAKVIDLNMGCPSPRVVANGDGAALMRDPSRAVAIASAVIAAVGVPVTAKLRKGWEAGRASVVELGSRLVEAGVASLTVHGRAAKENYSVRADWDALKQVKESVPVPVIGNGDVFEPRDALRMLEQTGCDAVMIARGALGNPWLLSRAIALVENGELWPPPSMEERFLVALEHFELAVNSKGEQRAAVEMRKHLAWYVTNLPGGAKLRSALVRVTNLREVKDLLGSGSIRHLEEVNLGQRQFYAKQWAKGKSGLMES